ncbi:MAG: heat-inducible transcription repressor HrcA [Caldilineaceae bacterium]|nr:heat-inducible transcription repressor HrcA [Caldilineaceae bacterium]
MVNQLSTLTPRQAKLLGIVIQEYVKTAQPVGSNAIAQDYDLGVSSATIRNDLATLEREGLLTHPHTSAGRVPTDMGYRYFVQHLLSDAELSTSERRDIRVQFSQARQEMDQWLRLSTSVLARTTQSAALATAPRTSVSRFKHLELVAIHGIKVLLILVLQEGAVKQQLLDLDQPMEQAELSRTSNELNDLLVGLSASAISERVGTLSPFAGQVALLVVELIAHMDRQSSGQIYRDGLMQILDAPEFAEGNNARRIVQVFEEQSVLEQVVDQYGDRGDIHVVISGDGRFAELRDISLVLARYGVMDHATGLLGVMGPRRMLYGRTMGAVRFVAALMSEMVEEIYSP